MHIRVTMTIGFSGGNEGKENVDLAVPLTIRAPKHISQVVEEMQQTLKTYEEEGYDTEDGSHLLCTGWWSDFPISLLDLENQEWMDIDDWNLAREDVLQWDTSSTYPSFEPQYNQAGFYTIPMSTMWWDQWRSDHKND